MNHKKRRISSSSGRIYKSKKARFFSRRYNFASTDSFVSAVARIYNQEMDDIDRFIRFANHYRSTSH